MLAVCEMAGAEGRVWGAPMPAAALADAWPAADQGGLPGLLHWVFSEGPVRLQIQACEVLGALQRRLPEVLLPLALDQGRRSVALRRSLLPVLGQRGTWLAARHDDWRYAAASGAEDTDESLWQQGSIEQRRAFLLRERAADPARARDRLQAALPELGAKERADLAEVLGEALSLNDEPLLEMLRGDRSREVRAVALSLLLRLRDAAHPGRAGQRMASLLELERGLLRRKWVVRVPTQAQGDWKADNLDTPRPTHDSLGEQAWWLYQHVRQVPLAWWTEHTGMDAAELLAWAAGTDWHEALVRGWRDVLTSAPELPWTEAFLKHWPVRVLREDRDALLALLPRAQRERHWQAQLKEGATVSPFHRLAHQMLGACVAPDTLSVDLSTAVIQVLSAGLKDGALKEDHALRYVLPELCCLLHVDSLEQAVSWAASSDDTPSLVTALQTATQIIAIRRALHQFSLQTSHQP